MEGFFAARTLGGVRFVLDVRFRLADAPVGADEDFDLFAAGLVSGEDTGVTN